MPSASSAAKNFTKISKLWLYLWLIASIILLITEIAALVDLHLIDPSTAVIPLVLGKLPALAYFARITGRALSIAALILILFHKKKLGFYLYNAYFVIYMCIYIYANNSYALLFEYGQTGYWFGAANILAFLLTAGLLKAKSNKNVLQ